MVFLSVIMFLYLLLFFSLRNLDIKCKKSNFSDFLGWKGFSFSIGRRSFDWRKILSVGGAAPKLTKAQKTRTRFLQHFPLFERLAGYKVSLRIPIRFYLTHRIQSVHAWTFLPFLLKWKWYITVKGDFIRKQTVTTPWCSFRFWVEWS